MKTTEHFKEVIEAHLNIVASKDLVFAEKMKNESKSIDDCIQYILNEVQKSGCNGFVDAEIFGMAIHYYDESEIDIGKPIEANVIVNRSIPTDAPKREVKARVKVKPQTQQEMPIEGSLF